MVVVWKWNVPLSVKVFKWVPPWYHMQKWNKQYMSFKGNLSCVSTSSPNSSACKVSVRPPQSLQSEHEVTCLPNEKWAKSVNLLQFGMWPYSSESYYSSGYFPFSSHQLRITHYSGSSQGRGHGIWPMRLIAPRQHGVYIRTTMAVECTRLSSVKSETITQSCMIISCKDATVSVCLTMAD